jgi:hypothetical protein
MRMMKRDLDMSDVEADARMDPTLDRLCEEDGSCEDPNCPLQHTDDEIVEDPAALYEAMYPDLNDQDDHYERFGRPAFPNEY